MRTVILLALLAASPTWQQGVWRDVQHVTEAGGGVSIPVGGGAGVAPLYLTFPADDPKEVVTIDGPDGLRYVAWWRKRLPGVIINDPVAFAIDGNRLLLHGPKRGQTYTLTIVSTTRLP